MHLCTATECSCACRRLSLNPCQLSWAPMPFRAAFHVNPPCFQTKYVSALLKCRIRILLLAFLTHHGIYSFMSAATKATSHPCTSSALLLGSKFWSPWQVQVTHSLWSADFLTLLQEDFADFLTLTRRTIAHPHHQVTFTAPGDPTGLYSVCLWRG